MVDAVQSLARAVADDAPRAEILKLLSDVIDQPVEGWLKLGERNAQYVLALSEGREVKIGPIGVWLHNSKAFVEKVTLATGRRPKFERKQWPTIVDALLKITDQLDPETDEEAFIEKALLSALRAYLVSVDVYQAESMIHAFQAEAPLAKDGLIYYRMAQFLRWMADRADAAKKLDRAEVLAACKRLGIKGRALSAYDPERGPKGAKCRHYYQVDPDLLRNGPKNN